jgi:hypothetical protein
MYMEVQVSRKSDAGSGVQRRINLRVIPLLFHMALSIHAPVQDANNIYALVHCEIKNQVLAGRVNAQPLVQFIPTLPQFRTTCQFRTDISQAVYVVPVCCTPQVATV